MEVGTDDERPGELDDKNCVVVGGEVGKLDCEVCVVLVISEEVLRF